jgi:hypothetical protein
VRARERKYWATSVVPLALATFVFGAVSSVAPASADEGPQPSADQLALARTGARISPNAIKGRLAAEFPEAFGGLYPDVPDGSAYTVLIVGDDTEIERTVREALASPENVGPLPVVTFKRVTYSLATLADVAHRIVVDNAAETAGTIVSAGVSELQNGVVVETTDPKLRAESLASRYAVPIVELIVVGGNVQPQGLGVHDESRWNPGARIVRISVGWLRGWTGTSCVVAPLCQNAAELRRG